MGQAALSYRLANKPGKKCQRDVGLENIYIYIYIYIYVMRMGYVGLYDQV